VDVKQEWEEITEFNKQTIDRLPKLQPVFEKNIRECGEVFPYDYKWDRVTQNKPGNLKNFNGNTFEESVYDDPIMVELMEAGEAEIFTTDVVASVLMSSSKSNYSWDVEIKKVDGIIIIDKRTDDDGDPGFKDANKMNILNYQTVCETAMEHQPTDNDTIHGIKKLMKEAQLINQNWLNAAQRPGSDTVKFENPDPFIEDENQVATKVGYLYKVWRIQEADEATGKKVKRICIRCTVHTKLPGKNDDGSSKYANVYAINEHNLSRSNWRQDIDSNIVPILNKEIEDNSFKTSRWFVQSLLAGTEQIKIAFVTRDRNVDPSKHVVLATHTL